jgi:acyl-CoA synthetase (AMP-forming)/AMP-acid ligase II/acyl carrier protein
MASLSFDVFSGDLVRALCSGAALVIVPQELLFAPSALHALIELEQIDAAEFVPVVLRELMEHLENSGGSLQGLRLLAAGSDSWYNHEYARVRRLCGPSTRVVNSYGLTEATIDSTYFDGSLSDASGDALVPLGRAFPNTEILLLDRLLQPVPVGVAAELFVGGLGLARGYLHRPDLTAERFVPHPYSTVPGARLYRTGDLARYLADGTLELLGRIDQQVKLRGHRIELAEVEAVLSAHVEVTDAVAIVREDRRGDRRLVAYVVMPGASVTVAQLRQQLRETMPDYMVPTAIVRLDALPLTPNGKVDRSALPAPDGERLSDEAFVAPKSATEQRLVAIWSEVLRVDQVGVNDNFFDLGGHSRLVVQLHGRIRSAMGVDISVLDLFRHPTVAALARHLAGAGDQTSQAGVTDARDRALRQRRAAARRRPGAVAGTGPA